MPLTLSVSRIVRDPCTEHHEKKLIFDVVKELYDILTKESLERLEQEKRQGRRPSDILLKMNEIELVYS